MALGVALGVPEGVPVALGVAEGLPLAVGVAVGLIVPLGVAVDDGVPLAVGVPVAVGLVEGEAVGVGLPPPVVPLSRNTWSGPTVRGTHVVFRAQVAHSPTPPPGFCQAAPWFDCTMRSVHIHAPLGINIMLAWISTQYVPAVRTAMLGRFTVKVLPETENG